MKNIIRDKTTRTKCIIIALPFIGYLVWAIGYVFENQSKALCAALFIISIILCFIVYRMTSGKYDHVIDWIDKHHKIIAISIVSSFLSVIIIVNIYQARHYSVGANAEDTAYYSQILWNTLHGEILSGNVQQERLYHPPVKNDVALHVSPILFILLPIYALFPHFLTLLILRDLVIALSAWPLFFLAREKLGNAGGVAAIIVYFLNPVVLSQSLESFYLLQLATFPLFMALYEYHRENLWKYLIWMGIAFSLREDVSIVFLGFGLLALIDGKNLKWKFLTICLPAFWWIFTTMVIQPAFGRLTNSTFDLALSGGNKSALGTYMVLLGSPGWIVTMLLDKGLYYIYNLLRPVGLLILFGFESFLLIPSVTANLFIGRVNAMGIDPLSRFALLPTCALIGGTVLIAGRYSIRQNLKKGIGGIVLLMLFPSACILDGAKDALQVRWNNFTVNNNASDLNLLIKQIPPSASVAAPNYVLPELSKRPKLYYLQYFREYGDIVPEFILVDENVNRITTNKELRNKYMELVRDINNRRDYTVLARVGEYRLFKHIHGKGS